MAIEQEVLKVKKIFKLKFIQCYYSESVVDRQFEYNQRAGFTIILLDKYKFGFYYEKAAPVEHDNDEYELAG